MIKAKVTYDRAAYTALMKFRAVKSKADAITVGVATLVLLVAFIVSIGTNNQLVFSLTLILILAIDTVIAYSYFLKPIIRLRKFNDANPIVNTFVFTEDKIQVTSNTKSKNNCSSYEYKMIFKACENKKAFYLFLNKNSALIITKSEITEGNEAYLRAFLTKKIPVKRNKLLINK
ncbi:MAG: YcxB family protein [Clostridia bacterium]|nr:YcxB family protein [Clostridia bacterium]